MARRTDNTSVPLTCSKINEVISAIESVDWGEDNYWDKETLVEIMEVIRKHNSDLRDFGNNLYNEKDSLEREVDALKSKIEGLNEYIVDLVSQINRLNEEIF